MSNCMAQHHAGVHVQCTQQPVLGACSSLMQALAAQQNSFKFSVQHLDSRPSEGTDCSYQCE